MADPEARFVSGPPHRPGVRRKRRLPLARLQAGGLLGVLAMVLSVPAYVVVETSLGAAAERAQWTITGPPCPVAARPTLRVVGRRKPRTFAYGGVNFTRWRGHASCVAFREARLFGEGEVARTCQFNNPGAVAVTAAGRTTLFEIGDARPATVTVHAGVASCVLGGWFRY